MDDSLPMGLVERVGDLARDLQRLIESGIFTVRPEYLMSFWAVKNLIEPRSMPC